MIVRLISESKIKDVSILSFINEYIKRLSPYFQLEVVEFSDSSEKSYKRYLDNFRSDDMVLGMDMLGKKFTSLQFADYFNGFRITKRSINFIIGESDGLSDLSKCYIKEYISLSDMTLSYRVSLIVVAEQVYRAMMIINNYPYHK